MDKIKTTKTSQQSEKRRGKISEKADLDFNTAATPEHRPNPLSRFLKVLGPGLALTDSEVLVLDRDDLILLFQRKPEAALHCWLP